MIGDHQDGMCYGDEGALLAFPSEQSSVLRGEITVFGVTRCPGGLHQGPFQPVVARCNASLTSFPGTFFVAGTHAERPRALQRPVAVCSDVIQSTGRSHAASPSVGVAGLAAQWIRVLHRRSQRHRERAGQRVMGSITRFITHRLRLKVNQAKSAVARPGQRKFLGFSFTGEREPRRRIAPKAIAGFKERIREQTRRTRGISLRQIVQETATYLRGRLGYFADCQTPSVLQHLETWLRRRLRSVVWKQWKRGRTRFRELRKRGISRNLAAKTAGSPHGPWRVANSTALHVALPNVYFAELGLPPMVCEG